jgi:hypothetical protein
VQQLASDSRPPESVPFNVIPLPMPTVGAAAAQASGAPGCLLWMRLGAQEPLSVTQVCMLWHVSQADVRGTRSPSEPRVTLISVYPDTHGLLRKVDTMYCIERADAVGVATLKPVE